MAATWAVSRKRSLQLGEDRAPPMGLLDAGRAQRARTTDGLSREAQRPASMPRRLFSQRCALPLVLGQWENEKTHEGTSAAPRGPAGEAK